MTAQPSTQIVPYQQLKNLLTSDEIRNRFMEVMGQRAPQFIASILNTVYLSDSLRNADPNSIISSAMTAAALNLPIDPNLGFAWLIPYKDNQRGGRQFARFQMGYKGYIQLAQRSGQYADLNTTRIYEGENIKVDRLTGRITLNGKRTGDRVIGYAFYFRLLNGFEKFIYWTVEEVTAHAMRYSKSWGGKHDIWKTNFDEMAFKTIISNGLRKWGLLSIEMQGVMRNDPDVADQEQQPIQWEPPIDGEYIDQAETQAFDPAQFLVDELVSENLHAAANLLKHAPDELKSKPDTLKAWGKFYRGWKDCNDWMSTEEAARRATSGEMPCELKKPGNTQQGLL